VKNENDDHNVHDVVRNDDDDGGFALPVDMKKGTLKRPSRTRDRRSCNVLPSNGNAPHTKTYSTTPRLCKHRYQLYYNLILEFEIYNTITPCYNLVEFFFRSVQWSLLYT